MLNLSNTTLLCVENRSPELGLYAINKCLDQATFHDVVFITNKQKINLNNPKIKLYECPNFKNGDEYSIFMLRDLHRYFSTDFCLVIQWDGFIVNPLMWQSDFFKYDYVGSSWPHHPDTPVGNGGFSLRSKKLAMATAHPKFNCSHPEDKSICIENKYFLETQLSIKFAPKEIADHFAVEWETWRSTFGFHGLFNFTHFMNHKELKNYIENLPTQMLGGHDTYLLIDALLRSPQNKSNLWLALSVLKKTRPRRVQRYKLHRAHIKRYLIIMYQIFKFGLSRT